jgi:hypothetical protein
MEVFEILKKIQNLTHKGNQNYKMYNIQDCMFS